MNSLDQILKGSWRNELGSVMSITEFDDKTNQFNGTYQTAVSMPDSKGDKISFESKWPVRGFITSDILAFVVDYTDKHPSLASFTGHLITTGDKIKINAHWILASTTLKQDGEEPTPLWASMNIGFNLFTKQ